MVAGFSIGSLYQYFPDKLGLAEEIRKRHLGAVLTSLSASDEGSEMAILDQRIINLIDGVIAGHAINQELHRALLEEVPFAPNPAYENFENVYQERYRNLIATGSDKHNDVAGRVLAAAVEGVVNRAVRYGELALPIVKEELIRMVTAYLQDRTRQSCDW